MSGLLGINNILTLDTTMKDVMLYSIRALNLVKPDSIIDGVDSEVTVTVAASPSLGISDVLNSFLF